MNKISTIFKEHSDNFKPKMLTTNKYFQLDFKPVSKQGRTDYDEINSSCI